MTLIVLMGCAIKKKNFKWRIDMRKYFLWKSSDQDKSFVENFNSILMKTKKAKIITLAVLLVCFIMSVYVLSESPNSGGGSTVFSSPKDKAISKIKHYEKLNNNIVKDLRDEDIDKAFSSYKESNEYFQEVLLQDEYLNDTFNMDLITKNSYYYVYTSGNALLNEIAKHGENTPRLTAFINECVGYAQKANEHMEYVLDEIDEEES